MRAINQCPLLPNGPASARSQTADDDENVERSVAVARLYGYGDGSAIRLSAIGAAIG